MSISGQPPHGVGTPAPGDSNQQPSHHAADAAGAAMGDAKQQSAEHYEHLRERATDQIDSLAEGAQSAATALEGKDSLGISQYLEQLATGMSSFADRVRNKSAEDLLHEGTLLARNNPALFVAGSVAIGFGLSRFLRASATHVEETASTEAETGASSSPSGAPTGPETPGSVSTPTMSAGSLTSAAIDTPLPGSNMRGNEP
ncbi:hypothetical protein D16iCDA_02760 [Pseudomonas seleniipraecipitans]|uniref:DUF3618 domain-containing protein n=1 Tax=Phytopseudomonas seleniipraecipitans TaxID=640205 RepID=A0ABY5J9B1_9GAMM|nr:hypothetical protein [Pseudomonas seleniipraecipitans]UUD64642.1 hypothetical protein D16iCDA_02760 [Pseudomonas seleniipraecipitans]